MLFLCNIRGLGILFSGVLEGSRRGLMEAAVCVFCVRVTGGEVSILSSTVIISFRYIRCGGYGFLLSRGSLLAKCFVCRD